MIKILLADDQALIRSGIRSLLEAEDDIEVVAEASDGQQAVALTAEHRPDIALIDIQMPAVDGIEATRRIVADERLDSVHVVILTNFGLDEYIFAALRAGASGFLLKDTQPADLLQALRVVMRGDALLSPAVTRRLIGEFPHGLCVVGEERWRGPKQPLVPAQGRGVVADWYPREQVEGHAAMLSEGSGLDSQAPAHCGRTDLRHFDGDRPAGSRGVTRPV